MIASAENIVRISPISSIPLKKGTCKSARSCKINVGFVLIPITLKCAVLPWKGPSSWSTDLRKTFSFYANRAYQSDSIQWLLNSRYWFSLKDESKTSRISLEFEAVGGWGRVEWSGWRYWDNFKFHVEILCSEFLTLENKLFSICSAIASFILSGSCRCKTALC